MEVNDMWLSNLCIDPADIRSSWAVKAAKLFLDHHKHIINSTKKFPATIRFGSYFKRTYISECPVHLGLLVVNFKYVGNLSMLTQHWMWMGRRGNTFSRFSLPISELEFLKLNTICDCLMTPLSITLRYTHVHWDGDSIYSSIILMIKWT